MIKNETIDAIPLLHVVKEKLNHVFIPTVFFLHGFTSAKEHNLHVAYLLAERGFRVILPDALHHGERENSLRGEQRALSFWEIVLTSIKEIGKLKDALEKREIIDKEQRIGMMGTSMGAMTMYGTLTKYNWINTAVSFMGTAYYTQFAKGQLELLQSQGKQLEEHIAVDILAQIKPYDLSTQLEKIAARPLLIWHGQEDRLVPHYFSEQLHKEILVYYANKPDHLKYISEEKASHKVSRYAVLQAVKWFETHLLRQPFQAVK